jgi:DNA-binding protein
MSKEKKVSNEIRIGLKTKPKDVISQCQKLINEEKVKELHLSAVGNTIGNLVVAVEIVKSIFPDLYQSSEFSTIPARANGKDKDKKPDSKPQKLYPRLEIILSSEKKEGSKFTVTEEEKKILIDTLEKQKEAFTKIRKFRRNFRNARRRVFSGRRQKLSFSAKNSGFNNRRQFGYNKRTFVKSPTAKRNNLRKFNAPKNNSVAKQTPVKN